MEIERSRAIGVAAHRSVVAPSDGQAVLSHAHGDAGPQSKHSAKVLERKPVVSQVAREGGPTRSL